MSVKYIKVEPAGHQVTVKSTGQRVTVASSSQVRIVTVGKVGPSGPVGPQGAAGTPRVEVPFSFGDATPLALFTSSAGKLIERVTVFIETAFDGAGAALTIGDGDDPDALMSATENNPTEQAAYQTTPNFSYQTNTQILLFITPGSGASQGSGLVAVETQT
jgi:hypothetical protein